MFDRAGENVGDRLNAAVGMPGEPLQIVLGLLVAKIVEQQEWIELLGLAEAEGALQLNAGAFEGRRGVNDLSNWSQLHDSSLFSVPAQRFGCAENLFCANFLSKFLTP